MISEPSSAEDFDRWTAPFRRELLAHCYRMTGSFHDAEDLLQETLSKAWRARNRYDADRASVRTWLYRIATNTCLTEIERRSRRALPSSIVDVADDVNAVLAPDQETAWLEPFPTGDAQDPLDVVMSRESLRLAFVAASQMLPARQRAILLLRDVLQWPAADVADCLEVSVAAVNSGLQRARETIGRRSPGHHEQHLPSDAADRALLENYVDAFSRADVDELARLLRDDVVLEMPPVPLWFEGAQHYRAFIRRVFTMRPGPWRTILVSANGQPAFAAYARGGEGRHHAHSIQVLEVVEGQVAHNVVFADPRLFRAFELPDELAAEV
jgi:RNA polymerase sigma-70 factor (ECF subfamily)